MNERKEFRDLVDPAVARASIDAFEIDPGDESVPLEAARGRVLAERIDADIDVPGFDRATVDGYAVRSNDVVGANEGAPVVLDLVDSVHAGERPSTAIEAGQVIEISTGAVLPDDADAVVMVERTRSRGGEIAVESPVAPGDNVMSAGADVAAGHRAIGPGHRLTARDIALLAALGTGTVQVRAAPRIGIVSTGDELVRPGASLDHQRGQIFDVNSHALVAAIDAAGGDPVLYEHVGDDPDEMRAVLERAAEECHLVCSSGSTSASAVDVIYRVIEERGEIIHHGVGVKPGKPMLIGRMGETNSAYVGLPGFPVSALMTFRHFVAPRIRRAARLPDDGTASMEATMADEARFGEGRLRLLPVGIVEDAAGTAIAYPVDKGSGATTSLAHADGLVEVPPDTDFVAEGERVTVDLFDRAVRPPSILAVGEDDPVFADLLDRLEAPRFLPTSSREAGRRLDRDIPDVAVLAGQETKTTSGTVIGAWRRRWGVALPADNPGDIEGIDDVLDGNGQFANLAEGAIRNAFDDRLESIAADRSTTVTTVTDELPGYGFGRPGHQSAARRVADDQASAGLALERTASALGLDFLPVGEQSVHVIADDNRREKAGVADLRRVIESDLSAILDDAPGYCTPSE